MNWKNLKNSLDCELLEVRNYVAFILVWVLTCSECSVKFCWKNCVRCRITVKAVCEITSPVLERAIKHLSSSVWVCVCCCICKSKGRKSGGRDWNKSGHSFHERKSTSYERGQYLLTDNWFLGNIIVSVQDPIREQTYTSYFSKEFNMKS